MRVSAFVLAFSLVLVPTFLSAQLTEETLRERIESARMDGHAEALVEASDAARFMRHFGEASELLDQASEAIANAQFDLLWSRIILELASGGGINGAQRAFRETRDIREIPPLEMAYWLNNFPTLLVGGEFDDLVERFAADAEDPNYQCACYDRKAWMHTVAGRPDVARIYWDSLVVYQEMNPSDSDDPDVLAEFQAQLARNYARAGREDDARRTLAGAMQMPVTDEALATVRRRWAQAYAELGDVDEAVEQLEYLLSIPSLVTVHSLETRLSWAPIRQEPAFRALLERHRGLEPHR